MVQDVDVDVVQVFHDFILLGIAVQSDKDGVGYVRPERGVLHGDVPAPAIESHTGGIHGGTVIGIAAEHAVEQYVVAGKHVHPVTPSVGADSLYVAYRHAVRATGGALRGHNAFYLYVSGIDDSDTCPTAFGVYFPSSENLHILCVYHLDAAFHDGSSGNVHGLARRNIQGIARQPVHARSEINQVAVLFQLLRVHARFQRIVPVYRIGEEVKVVKDVAVDFYRQVAEGI